MILDTTERLLVEIGYGALSTRKVAARAGVTPALIHYYFKTTDDLLVAVYRRAANESRAKQAEAFQQGGVAAMWHSVSDRQRMALAIEFMAMANHRPAIRAEISKSVERARAEQQRVIEQELARHPDVRLPFSPLVLTVMAAAIGQALVMEEGVGIGLGHEETRAAMTSLVHRLLATG
ncbi:TetR/AcrR family transcriptional regulator [Novosphingobium sp. YJ-S2-02]|uniref:TetR/AcrR family transcriptional regulator n=1 Tax=Novosphingobium aureum TaxID=2792964 RepID=A0A931HG71_9SPHN|nr:TetR/AcrR family transcriptional regulator [Novosphingobium aureum]MBH0115189.1 TetR/AcrR family transcriptional regulator [Novosphingobium aureum]